MKKNVVKKPMTIKELDKYCSDKGCFIKLFREKGSLFYELCNVSEADSNVLH